jgi:hypothetical protein
MKYVIVIDYYDSLQFFERLLDSISSENIYVVTNLASVYIKVRSQGMHATLINRFSNEKMLERIDCTKAKEVAALEVSEDDAKAYASKIYSALIGCLDDLSSYKILCWNGSDLKGAAIRLFISDYSGRASSMYFEITNFPGYFFSDTAGVNAQSSAFLEPENFKLIDIERNKDSLIKLKDELIASKKVGIPPQVELSKRITFRHIADVLYQLILGASNLSFKAIFNRFSNKLRTRRGTLKYSGEYLNNLTSKHAFMPLQVASDSQLLINYHGDVLDSVKEANEVAKSAGKVLVVKFHPAENDQATLSRIISYCVSENIGITSLAVPEAIDLSGLVVTVNSTSGFEAQLEGRPVIYLGASQYSNLSSELELLQYINKYFNKGDFFSHDDISNEDSKKLGGI